MQHISLDLANMPVGDGRSCGAGHASFSLDGRCYATEHVTVKSATCTPPAFRDLYRGLSDAGGSTFPCFSKYDNASRSTRIQVPIAETRPSWSSEVISWRPTLECADAASTADAERSADESGQPLTLFVVTAHVPDVSNCHLLTRTLLSLAQCHRSSAAVIVVDNDSPHSNVDSVVRHFQKMMSPRRPFEALVVHREVPPTRECCPLHSMHAALCTRWPSRSCLAAASPSAH